MKISYIILAIFIIVSLTSCTSTDKQDINEFIKRYNKISESAISKESFLAVKENKLIKHSIILQKNTILTLVSNENCEINECAITALNENLNNMFTDNCINILRTICHCDEITADKLISESKDKEINTDNYKIMTNHDKLQTTVIITINKKDDSFNKTLKESLLQ